MSAETTPMMNDENARLSTFEIHKWPIQTTIDKARLAKAGFFYRGDGTEVNNLLTSFSSYNS